MPLERVSIRSIMMVEHVQMTPVLLSVGLRLRYLPDTRGLVLQIQHPPPPHPRSQLLAFLRMWRPVSTALHPGYQVWGQGGAEVRVFIYIGIRSLLAIARIETSSMVSQTSQERYSRDNTNKTPLTLHIAEYAFLTFSCV